MRYLEKDTVCNSIENWGLTLKTRTRVKLKIFLEHYNNFLTISWSSSKFFHILKFRINQPSVEFMQKCSNHATISNRRHNVILYGFFNRRYISPQTLRLRVFFGADLISSSRSLILVFMVRDIYYNAEIFLSLLRNCL